MEQAAAELVTATIGLMVARRGRGTDSSAVRLTVPVGWTVAFALCGLMGCSSTSGHTASRDSVTAAVAATTAEASEDPLAQQARADLAAPTLGQWVNGALAAASAPGELVCTTPYSPLDSETFELAGQVGDQVTAEMLLNLDAALGAAAEWCRQGDTTAAAAEHADAQATAAAIEARLVEIGVR